MTAPVIAPGVANSSLRIAGRREHDAPGWVRLTSADCRVPWIQDQHEPSEDVLARRHEATMARLEIANAQREQRAREVAAQREADKALRQEYSRQKQEARRAADKAPKPRMSSEERSAAIRAGQARAYMAKYGVPMPPKGQKPAKPAKPEKPEGLTVSQAAHAAGCCTNTIFRGIRSKRIPSVLYCTRIHYVRLHDVREYLSAQAAARHAPRVPVAPVAPVVYKAWPRLITHRKHRKHVQEVNA